MDEMRDGSMLFSLRGLIDLEKARVDREAADKRRRQEMERATAQQRASLVRQAEEQKRLAALAASREAEQRVREDAARLQALEHAAVEAARVEAEGRARLELAAKQQEHERRMTAIREETRRKTATQLAILGFSLAGIVVAAASGLYLFELRPEARRLQAAYDELVLAERNRAEETKRLLERSEKRRVELAAELGSARDRIAVLERAPPSDALRTHPGPGRDGAKDRSQPNPGRRPCADDGDPLDPCLK